MNVTVEWSGLQTIPTRDYRCAYCDRDIASERGWVGTEYVSRGTHQLKDRLWISICPRCGYPTFL